jgi:hypothetical protein
MNEASTWEWLRDVILPLGHYSRIESPNTAPGFPDVHFQIEQGAAGTMELKCNRRTAKIPFRDEKKGMRVSQLRWIKENVRHGGNVWVIAEVKHCVYVIHGSKADKINGSTQDELEELATALLYRETPERATKILHELLNITWRYG